MCRLPQVARHLQHVLTEVPETLGRASGFTQRQSKLTAAGFVQTVVLGWLAHPEATLAHLTQTAAARGVRISPQGLDQRFTPVATELVAGVLAAAVHTLVRAEPVATELLHRFAGVVVLDSTTVTLPDGLATVWAGCGGRVTQGSQAALKLTLHFDLLTGQLTGPVLTAGRAQDRASILQHAPLPPGTLRLADLGFWSLTVLRELAAQGAFWLSRLNLQVGIYTTEGTRLELTTWLGRQTADVVDLPVMLGVDAQVPARLLAVRVPRAVAATRRRKLRAAAKREGRTPATRTLMLASWTLLVTNVPANRLTVVEALILARARWQVELLFKRWKTEGKLDASRSANPERIQCELLAKLTAMVLQHWILLSGCWRFADRSLVRAAQVVRAQVISLVLALSSVRHLVHALAVIQRCLAAAGTLAKRRAKPSTSQLLTDPSLGGLA